MIGLKTKIELPTKNLCSTRIPTLAKIAKLVNIGQIRNLEYLTIDSFVVESVVDGKLMDENKTHLLTSIGTFYFIIETISIEKECEKGLSQLMPHFDNNTFFNPRKKKTKKTSLNQCQVFSSNAFSKSNEKV
jgi:hypothetical protein